MSVPIEPTYDNRDLPDALESTVMALLRTPQIRQALHDKQTVMSCLPHWNAEYGIMEAYEKPTHVLIIRRGHGQSLREIDMQSISRTPSIYQIRHIESGKVYVGSAIDPQKRCKEHRSALLAGRHHSRYLQRSWNKHGEDAFVFEIIEPVLFIEDLIAREQHWINTAQSSNSRHGYNVSPTAGSPLGVKHTDETRAANAQRGRARSENPSQREEMSKRRKAAFSDPQAQERHAAAQKKRFADPIERAKLSERGKAQFADPDARAKMSDLKKAEWADPAVRAKHSERAKIWSADPAFRAKQSEGTKAQFADPERRARWMAARWPKKDRDSDG